MGPVGLNMPSPLPSARRPWWLRVHWLQLAIVLALAGLGLPFLRSAASEGEYRRQLLWMTIGLLGFSVMSCVDYRFWLRRAYAVYAVSVGLLLFVLRFSAPIKGGGRWIPLWGFNVQPSEIFKLALVLTLARYLSWRGPIRSLAGLAIPFALMAAPAVLIQRQPDLGTALTLPPTLLAMLFVAGASSWRIALAGTAGLAAAIPLWWEYGMVDYQKRRVLAWLDPEGHANSAAFHLIMGLTAISQGGLYGRGLGNGTLNELDLLPEKHNDFIFGVVAEEGGLLAAGAMTALFLLLVLGSLSIAAAAVDEAGRLLAVGVATLVGGQALMNIGVATGLLPTTGVTLPLISYGGSSLLMTLAMLGLVMNVAARENNPGP